MALALLGRRQGRSLLRSLAVVETYLASGGISRPNIEDLDVGPDVCSTSQQHPSPIAGWLRTHPVRFYAINNEPTIKYVPVPEPEYEDFSGEPTTYLQLLGAIGKARSLKRLQHLLTTHGDRFDSVHVAAAVARLPRLIKYRPADMVDRSDAVLVPTPGLPRLRRKHGAQPKQTHLAEGARLAAQLDALLPSHVHNFFPRQAACTIWAFGELRRRGVVERMDSLPDVLLAVTKGKFEPLRVHGHGVDFAQLLQGLAKLGFGDMALLEQLVPLLQERLGSMQQHELQMCAWSLASLGYHSPAVFNAIANQLLRTGTAFLLPSGCSSAFWAYAKAGVAGRVDLFGNLAGSMLGQATLLAPQDAATTLWACSRLGYHNAQLVNALCDAMVRSLATCSDWEVSSVVESLAVLGHQHSALMEAVATAILAEPVIGAHPTCIARVLFGYGKLGCRAPRDLELAAVLAAALVPQLPMVREDTLAMACNGLRMFGFKNEVVLAALASRAERLLPDSSEAHLLPVLRLLSCAGYSHYQLAVASARHLQSVILPSSQSRSAAGAVELLFLCARQGVEDPSAAEELLAFSAAREQELRPVDAARLLVVGQVNNRKEELLSRMADVVAQHADELDTDTAAAALRSAQLLGRQDVAAALSMQLQQPISQSPPAGKVAVAAV
ncbi:hypothetical protein PLESTB_001053100 [Pleodorina starrii]|uniref:Uncharacterized protein n=1 Tax=Pleodorina starrii TaxID=330485 RepID=A0A9W6F4Z0_9CHLO|nr:hypothetical protein PLESTM_001271400 [Pleodorina starrii]GLC55995.1 hypothetical protein PLESTB_001053100 [Pleodorina starrii]GLC63982.1 hypothetical protein PLESTF_000105600 [Pleodorina starrii]